jgi:HAD superfamily hydrolase (TIGR01509 family)
MTGLFRLFWLAMLAGIGAACQADFNIAIDIEEDGSGLVSTELVLDQEAADALLDLDGSSTLPLTDLAQAGWDIGPPVESGNGDTVVTAAKAFGTPDQFVEVMNELVGDPSGSGADDLIRDFRLTREQSFGRVDYQFSGILDPRSGLSSFTDPQLEAELGQSLTSIVSQPPYGAQPSDINVSLVVRMPGELQNDGTTGTIAGSPIDPEASWSVNMAGEQPVNVNLQTARRSISAQVLRGVAVVAGVLAALIAFAQLLRLSGSLRRRTPERKVRPTDARGRQTEQPLQAAPPEPVTPVEPETIGYRVVALDGMGVLYREGDDVAELLIPFARERGSTVPDEEIVVKARQLSLGRMTPADFWQVIGVDGDPNELDNDYLALHQLMPGVVKYLRALRDSGVRTACITNDAAAWATKLRASHSLDGFIDPWVISGSVGVRKPDAPLFEVLRRVTGEAPGQILVIDDELDNLDAAAALGFGTAWFTNDGERDQARGHEIFRGFDSTNAVNVVDTMDLILDEDVAQS